MSPRPASLADRKRLVLARAELERLRIRKAGQEAQGLLGPLHRARRAGKARPAALALVAAGIPLLGPGRLARVLRIAGLGLAALRLARSLRR